MKFPKIQRRTLTLVAVIGALLVVFIYISLRSGPLAPIEVTLSKVQSTEITPSLFGIGTIEARYT